MNINKNKMLSESKKNILFSALGVSLAEIATIPICTTKTCYQNTNSNSITNTIKIMYNNGGLKSFYRASYPAIGSQVFSTTSKYFLYKYLENTNYPYSNKFLNGLISGLSVSLVTHPIDFIKIHWQMNTSIIKTFKEKGYGSIYNGYSKNLLKTTIGSLLFFPLNDTFKEYFHNPILASACSAIISTTLCHPADYMKTRQIYGLPWFQGYNPKQYFKGLSINLIRIVPHFVIVMTTIEYLNNYYDSK